MKLHLRPVGSQHLTAPQAQRLDLTQDQSGPFKQNLLRLVPVTSTLGTFKPGQGGEGSEEEALPGDPPA